MEDVLFLNKPIHLNKFKSFDLESEEHASILEHLVLTLEGTIIAVARAKVEPFFSDPVVRKFRYGYLQMPDKLPLESEDDFFRLLSFLIPLEETA